MSYQIKMLFEHEGNPLFEVCSHYRVQPHDSVISAMYALISLLDFSNQKLDDDIIDHLKTRIEQLRYT